MSAHSTHRCCKAAARAAWAFCEAQGLEMPSAEWYTETRWGEQEVFNVMVRTDDDDWEPRKEFLAYVTKAASRAEGFEMHRCSPERC